MDPLWGVLPPLVTPFHTDGDLDVAAFAANLDAYAGHDLAGYLVLGSNGEAGALSLDEKLIVVREARARCPEGRRLLVGTGQESTRATIELTRRVADLGADAALVLTPHYYRPHLGEEALRRHYEAVADSSPIPVLLYTVPAYTGIALPAGLPSLLSGHPRIAGLKESSGDVGLMGRVLATVPDTFSVACGSAPVFYPALCLGARAGILAVACCTPALVAALYRAQQAGDHARARKLQAALAPLATAVTATWGVAGLKAAMDEAGLRGGACRPPLLPVPAEGRARLRTLLAEATLAAAG